jgi:four helix bundle protein
VGLRLILYVHIMATVKSFEELEVWKKSRELCLMIFQITRNVNFSKDFALTNQISRSSGSTMDNIAEGFERGSKKEFVQFLYIAKGSAGEVRSQLYRALDFKYISQVEFDSAYSLVLELIKKITSFIKYLVNTDITGQKDKLLQN